MLGLLEVMMCFSKKVYSLRNSRGEKLELERKVLVRLASALLIVLLISVACQGVAKATEWQPKVSLLGIEANQQSEEGSVGEVERKLDRLVSGLESLALKQEELNKRVKEVLKLSLSCCCRRRAHPSFDDLVLRPPEELAALSLVKKTEEQQLSNNDGGSKQENIGKTETRRPNDISLNSSGNRLSSNLISSSSGSGSPESRNKHESESNGVEGGAKEIHAGKASQSNNWALDELALDFGSSRSSAGDGSSSDEADSLLAVESQLPGKVALASESVTRSWMSQLMREQLASFRLSLGKVMSRLLEQTYQHETISGQLSLLKDECSLATHKVSPEQQNGAGEWARDLQQQPTTLPALKSSDLSLLIRLFAEELERIGWPTAPTGKSGASSSLTADQLELLIPQLRETLELSVAREFRLLSGRLDELSSVSKQSARLLSQLSAETRDIRAAAPRPTTTLVLTSEPVKQSVSIPVLGSYTQSGHSLSSSRWLSGSKVPAGSRYAQQQSLPLSSSPARPKPAANLKAELNNCSVSSSLARPRSCQELFASGATCSGKYLVWGSSEHESPRKLYCQMDVSASSNQTAGSGEAWTVILRRLDKSLLISSGELQLAESGSFLRKLQSSQERFDVDYESYKRGFGSLEWWGEFFIGLEPLRRLHSPVHAHSEVHSAPADLKSVELQLEIQLEGASGSELRLRFEHFRVSPESDQYRLSSIANCSGTPTQCGPLLNLLGAPFVPDCSSNSSSSSSSSAWWWSHDVCSGMDTPTSSILPERHLHWPGFGSPTSTSGETEPIKRFIMKVRTMET